MFMSPVLHYTDYMTTACKIFYSMMYYCTIPAYTKTRDYFSLIKDCDIVILILWQRCYLDRFSIKKNGYFLSVYLE